MKDVNVSIKYLIPGIKFLKLSLNRKIRSQIYDVTTYVIYCPKRCKTYTTCSNASFSSGVALIPDFDKLCNLYLLSFSFFSVCPSLYGCIFIYLGTKKTKSTQMSDTLTH